MAIEQNQVMPLLLNACPSFTEKWEDYVREEDTALIYLCLGEFARHLLELYRQGEVGEFPAIADAIERLHIEGISYVREAATIGLLEDIQNIWGNNNVDPEQFAKYLKPESAKQWKSLNDFWEGDIPYVGYNG